MQISGKTVLLTGATGGIGHAIARRLHDEGANLILTGRRTDVLEPLAKELDAAAFAADLSKDSEVRKLVKRWPDVDIIVHNAALPASGALQEYTQTQINKVLAVNLKAPIALTRAYGDHMLDHQRGHVVFISSLAGKSGQPMSSLYSATKFGLRGFAQSLRADWDPLGIGVSCIFPGFVREAGMFADSATELPRGIGTSSPADVADAVVKAILKNRGEVDVAPIPVRLGATFGSVAPGIAAVVAGQRGRKLAAEVAEGQKPKR